MPLKYSTRKLTGARPRAYAALLASLLLLAAAALSGVGARAQRRNDNAQQQQGSGSRRVFVGRGSDTSSGSRVTIKSDDPLNDYSAYRSGDRFYVVLPKSAAGAVSKGSGKGYTDVQVQQRGDSVVVSYKVQPGAKPRVEQKFNRLDVVFDVKDGGQPAASGQESSASTQQQQPSENRNPNASAQQQQQQQQAAQQQRQTATPETPNERRPAEVVPNAGTPAAANSANNSAPTAEAAQQPGASQTQPASTPAAEQSASGAPTAEPQIAQNQPPAPIAPITNPNSSAAGAQSGASFGTMLVNNWPIALFVALFVVGLGLVFFARRSSGQAPAELEPAAVATATPLAEQRAARLEEAKAPTAKEVTAKEVTADADAVAAADSSTLAEAAPLVTAATVAAGNKKKKKDRKAKSRGGRAEELPLAKAETVEEPAVEPTLGETRAELAAPPVEEIAVAEPEAATVEALKPETEAAPVEVSAPETEAVTVEAPVVVPTQAAEASTQAVESPAQAAEDSTTHAVEEVSEAEAPRELSLTPAVVALESSAAESLAEASVEPVAEPALTPVKSIAPAVAPDAEEVQSQTRRLLEGEPYDRSVIGSDDSMARQLIGAELLSALAGRNVERRERARAAFVEHGYFDEKTRDVREAAAPAERAAAARSLAIVNERAAAPHLIAALEDDSMEVRRASVEALGALREPTAFDPLEALLLRERNERNRIPTRIIQHAIEACRLAAVEEARAASERARVEAEAPAAAETVEAAAVETRAVEPAAAEVETEVVETRATEPEAFAHEVSEASPATEAARVEETTRVEEAATLEELAPQVEEAAPRELEVAPVASAAETETVVETQPAEEPRTIEEPSPAGEAPALDESGLSALEVESAGTPVAESNAVEPLFATHGSFDSAVAGPPVKRETAAVAEESGAATVESSKADEWIEFDMDDMGASSAASSAAPPAESVFESSSGEAIQAEHAESQTSVAEPLPFETADETPTVETSAGARDVEAPFEWSPAETAAESRVFEEAAEEHSVERARGAEESESAVEPLLGAEAVTAPLPSAQEKGVVPFDAHSTVPAAIQQRLTSRDAFVRAAAVKELSHVDTDEAFQQICSAFDDDAKEVRSAAARALYELRTDRAESFTRALREAGPDRRRNIGAAVSNSGLAGEAISQLTGESRDKTYEAFSLLFLMAKAGEVQPLVRAIEAHPNNEVRLAVVKLLALSGQKEILPAFRRLAVRGSLPTEVRSAVMEAIYQISSSQPTPA
jgi:HEAT repeat protein